MIKKIKEKVITILMNLILNWLLKKVRKQVGPQTTATYQKVVKEFIERTEVAVGVKADPKELRLEKLKRSRKQRMARR